MKHEIFITTVFLLSRTDMSNSFEMPGSVAHKAPLSMGNLQARILSGLPCLPSGDLPNTEIKLRSPNCRQIQGSPPPKYGTLHEFACHYYQFSSVQFSRSGHLTLWDPMDWSSPGFPTPSPGAYSNACSSSHWCHLIISHPLLLLPSIFPSIRVFSNESVLSIRWPKYWTRAK